MRQIRLKKIHRIKSSDHCTSESLKEKCTADFQEFARFNS